MGVSKESISKLRSMSNANICWRLRCSKKVEKHCSKVILVQLLIMLIFHPPYLKFLL